MAITYVQAGNPLWYFPDIVGRAAGGGKLSSFSSFSRLPKFIYKDSNGAIAWENPITFPMNGEATGPFYFLIDDAVPDDRYYLEFVDAQDHTIVTLDEFPFNGSTGSGGGTTYIQLKNYIINGQFWRYEELTPAPIAAGRHIVAPCSHEGIIETTGEFPSHPPSAPFTIGPEYNFVKTDIINQDTLTFIPFGLSSTVLAQDVTPDVFMRYSCTTNNPAEGPKYLEFPITAKVGQLSGELATFTLWMQDTLHAGLQVVVDTVQFFGNGGTASDPLITNIGTPLITQASWTKYVISFTIPNVSSANLGQCANDAIYMRINFPVDVQCQIDLTKPSLYLGLNAPSAAWDNMDMIAQNIFSPRTGDIRYSAANFKPFGYVAMDDGSIGNPSSGASNRKNFDTFNLFYFLYTTFDNTLAPVSGGRSGGGTSGLDAIADFNLNKNITLTKAAARVLAGVGGGHLVGTFTGSETHTLLAAELPPHAHGPSDGRSFTTSQPSNISFTPGATAIVFPSGSVPTTDNGPGTSTPFNIIQPTAYYNIFIKL